MKWTLFRSKDIQYTDEKVQWFATRDMLIKTTLKFYLLPERITVIKKSSNNKCWYSCGEKEWLLLCWWECKQYNHYVNYFGDFIKKVEIPFEPAIPCLFSKKVDIILQRHMLTNAYISSSLNSKILQEECISINRWMDK